MRSVRGRAGFPAGLRLFLHRPCVVRILIRRIEQRLDLFRRQRIQRGIIWNRCTPAPRMNLLSRWIALCSAFFSAHYLVQFFHIQHPSAHLFSVHCPSSFLSTLGAFPFGSAETDNRASRRLPRYCTSPGIRKPLLHIDTRHSAGWQRITQKNAAFFERLISIKL